MSTWHTVHVRVNDAATGQPTPVRLCLRQGEQFFAPLGRSTTFAIRRGENVGGQVSLGGEPHFYIDGTCEVRLPAGDIDIAISKGPEYTPSRQSVRLAPGQMSLRLEIANATDLRQEGWYSGDT